MSYKHTDREVHALMVMCQLNQTVCIQKKAGAKDVIGKNNTKTQQGESTAKGLYCKTTNCATECYGSLDVGNENQDFSDR